MHTLAVTQYNADVKILQDVAEVTPTFGGVTAQVMECNGGGSTRAPGHIIRTFWVMYLYGIFGILYCKKLLKLLPGFMT
jgi:hypothetical protein